MLSFVLKVQLYKHNRQHTSAEKEYTYRYRSVLRPRVRRCVAPSIRKESDDLARRRGPSCSPWWRSVAAGFDLILRRSPCGGPGRRRRSDLARVSRGQPDRPARAERNPPLPRPARHARGTNDVQTTTSSPLRRSPGECGARRTKAIRSTGARRCRQINHVYGVCDLRSSPPAREHADLRVRPRAATRTRTNGSPQRSVVLCSLCMRRFE